MTTFAERLERLMPTLKESNSRRDTPENEKRVALNALFRAKIPAKYAACSPPDIPGLLPGMCNGDGAFLCGNPGIGKTYAAVALARMYIERRVEMMPDPISGHLVFPESRLAWVTAPRFMCRIRSTISKRSGDTALEVMEEYERPAVLILDDLGAEKATDYAAEAIYDLLSARINAEKFTIVTSNLSPQEIAEWRPNIASRLCGFNRIVLPDRDRRLER